MSKSALQLNIVAVLKMPGNSSIKFEAADLIEAQAAQLAAAQARIAEAEKVIDALIFEMRAGTLILQGGAIDAAHAWKEGKP